MPGAFVSIHLESPGNSLSICEAFVYTDHGNYAGTLASAAFSDVFVFRNSFVDRAVPVFP